jgi:hypothetical protein
VSTLAAQPINTSRLDLLPLHVEHAEEMAAVLSDPALHTFIGGTPDAPQGLRSRYQRMTAGSPDPAVSWLNWVIRLRDKSCLTGTVQATVSPSGHGPIAEIAWVVGTPWQGRGIATEAARGPGSAGSRCTPSSPTSIPNIGHPPPSPLAPGSHPPTNGTEARSDGTGASDDNSNVPQVLTITQERALNAEDALIRTQREMRAQRTRIAEPLGKIRDLEHIPSKAHFSASSPRTPR